MLHPKVSMLAVASVVLFLCVIGEESGWQGNVNDQLLGKGFIDGAIVAADGSAVWAKSSNFDASAAELQALSNAFRSRPGDSLQLNARKYLILKANDQSIYLKYGNGGAICRKTGQTIIIGIYDANLQPGQAANIVEKFGDYLEEIGY